jgi:hypothetical protein
MDREPDDLEPGDRETDEARGAEDMGTTAAEQREGQPLDERLTEEEPERRSSERRDAGRLVEEEAGLVDEEQDQVAEEAEEDKEDRSAEESAVRIEEEPGGTTGGPDRYTEEAEGPA